MIFFSFLFFFFCFGFINQIKADCNVIVHIGNELSVFSIKMLPLSMFQELNVLVNLCID